MKIGIIGAGRLGICLALLIEDAGYDVIASDVRKDYISNLQKGIIDTTEPDVSYYLSESHNIEFTTDNLKVIKESNIIFTLVQTPSLNDDISELTISTFCLKSAKIIDLHISLFFLPIHGNV